MDVRPISTELQEVAENELNEVPKRIKEDLQHITNWITKQPHLNARIDAQWLVGFLRGCKFSLQKTKEKLDYFYTMRTLVPEFFGGRDPLLPNIQLFLQAGAVVPLPHTVSASGPKILLFRFAKCDPETMPLETLSKVYFMILDILLKNYDNAVVSGVSMIIDYNKCNLKYMTQYTPGFTKKLVLCTQFAYPLRLKEIYFINTPPVYEVVFKMIRSLMKDKLKNKMILLSKNNLDQIQQTIPKRILPKDYGGECDHSDDIAESWKKEIESNRDWFIEDKEFYSREKMRHGKPKTSADIFGIEGSFRALGID